MVQSDTLRIPADSTKSSHRAHGKPKSQSSGSAKTSRPGPVSTASIDFAQLDIELCLLLRDLIAPTLEQSDYSTKLQELKGHLFNKDYQQAFSEPYLAAYESRWVPSRALIYCRAIEAQMDVIEPGDAVLLGAGSGSEMIALMALSARHDSRIRHCVVIDSAPWQSTLERQHEALKTRLGDVSTLQYRQHDLLKLPEAPEWPKDLTKATYVTLFFVVSELILASRSSCVRLLKSLSALPKRATVHIIESASLGVISVGKEGRTYSLTMLLDLIFDSKEWDCLVDDAQKWYRLPPAASERVGTKLEDTRVIERVYQRKG